MKSMYDPIMRVLTVLEILQARERVSGSELAERLEVSLRTVQRYIARLQDLCIPVESARGVDGFYRLKAGFRLPPLMFTDEEAMALMLGLRGLRQLGLAAFAPATEGAAAKLERVLPEALRESVRTVEEVVSLEPGPWVISTSGEALIRVVLAIRARRRVSFQYRNHAGECTERQAELYGVAHVDGRWYVAGRCLLRQDVRTFRLDRVSGLETKDQVFERPEAFDMSAHLQTMSFVQSAYSIDVWLDLPLERARAFLSPHRVALTEEAGGTAVRCGRERLEIFAAMLLSMGCRVVVRNPAELRETFAALARRAAEAAGES